MSLGNMIRKLRKEKNMTQTELGQKINVAKSTISQYENNINTPDIKTIQKLAKIFEVSISYLLEETTERNTYQINPELANYLTKVSERKDLQLLFEKTKDLSPRAIQQILKIIQAIDLD
ncbi:MAG: helix-turn-helix domain-containing protein [Firmicutes bacterium]|nr:helix-turn-helix domain-containing protein [Bacillota bacterium]